MEQFSAAISSIGQLSEFLSTPELRENSTEASSILVQIYTASQDVQWLQSLTEEILAVSPSAHIVGATTCGEIFEGRSVFGQTIVTIYLFRTTKVHLFVVEPSIGGALEAGQQLRHSVNQLGEAVQAVMLLTTPMTINCNELINCLNTPPSQFQIFGGGASDNVMKGGHIVCGSSIYSAAAIAVAFQGPDYQVEKTTSHGWKALSKEMIVTQATGVTIHTIDDRPALEIYRHYFDIQDDEHFFGHAIGFPLLVYRGNELNALVPIMVEPDGSLKFISDIHQGEKLRIGFMDPLLIRDNSIASQRKMIAFQPEAILIFSCGSRRWVLREDVNAETHIFQKIAPTSGFYTTGEICNNRDSMTMLNLNIVTVGMREVSPNRNFDCFQTPLDITVPRTDDVFLSTHSEVLSRLLHFINALNEDLEAASHKFFIQSITDKLTQIHNRTKLDDSLESECARAKRYGLPFSIILFDVDHFKQINDIYGHNVGDGVLVRMAEVLQANVRSTDTIGRWGGEEFLVILNNTGPQQAHLVAEKIRKAIETTGFHEAGHQTASFGITGYCEGDDTMRILSRVDLALYQAKAEGRNRIVMK